MATSHMNATGRRERTDEALDVLVERLHEPRKDALKNDLHDRLARGRHAEDVVVPREARRHDGPTTPGRRRAREEHRVDEILPEELEEALRTFPTSTAKSVHGWAPPEVRELDPEAQQVFCGLLKLAPQQACLQVQVFFLF